MKNKQLILILIFLSLELINYPRAKDNFIYAQVTQEWTARYNGPGSCNSEAIDIALDVNGNVYVTGSSCNGYATIKYNSNGIQQWVAVCTSGYSVSAIAVDANGNVYATGWGPGTGSSADDYITVKYNNDGVQQWVARYNGPANYYDRAYGIAVDANGNVYVSGGGSGVVGAGFDYTTVKYNSSGVQQWVQRYDGPGNRDDGVRAITIDPNGNVYVTGYSLTGGTDYDYATIKYNTDGVQQWVQRYIAPGTGVDEALAIAVDDSGNVYVTGKSMGTTYDYATIKYNSNGVQQWVQRYDGPAHSWDEAWAIAVDPNGNVYVTGGGYGNGTSIDYETIKYNTGGVQQWVQRYNGAANDIDFAEGIAVDNSGNVYVTGQSSMTAASRDYATIKYNSSGVQQWLQTYNGPGNNIDIATSIAVDNVNNVYITGSSAGTAGGEYATIKYSQPIGITPVSNEIPRVFNLSQNYPNPFNPSTKIRFGIPSNLKDEASNVKLTVYDMLGGEVEKLVNEQLQPGGYEVEWNAKNYPSGVYFYTLKTEGFVQTKKMLLVK